MRPPEFTGGKRTARCHRRRVVRGFNEAAGIHRRKAQEEEVTIYVNGELQ